MAFEFPAMTQPSTGGAAFCVPGWTLRPAGNADESFLRRLYRTLRDDGAAFAGWDEAMITAFCNDQFDFQHADWTHRYPDAQFLIVIGNGAPIGRLYLDLSGASLHLIDIGLLPAWRRRGFGTAALGELKRRAAAANASATLRVARDNHAAAALYARQGFVAGESFASHVAMTWRPAFGERDAIDAAAPPGMAATPHSRSEPRA